MITTAISKVFIALVLISDSSEADDDKFLFDVFPPQFQWGFSSGSYQTEGAWLEDGKGLSIWDEFVHRTPSPIADHSMGDIACDSYHKYREDVAILKYFGVCGNVLFISSLKIKK
ncbi:myrosinase 1-like [Folsomia candida]|uniref:myrosinase 1-like n=1 Tax=Folsomia candida TaxID=158441 RepID=UPI001604EE15|nr:myrosinase 1-like [Folsomia candida]